MRRPDPTRPSSPAVVGGVLRRKPDGRAARFVIAYAARTVEDPALGAHVGFLDEIVPVAAAVRTVNSAHFGALGAQLR